MAVTLAVVATATLAAIRKALVVAIVMVKAKARVSWYTPDDAV
jgi:hypothetical protein